MHRNNANRVGSPRHKGKLILFRALIGACICLGASACDNPESSPSSTGMAIPNVEEIANTSSAPITLSQVSDVFSFGGQATDLQRELMRKKLLGSVVRWRIKIYDISSEEGGDFRVVSEPPFVDADNGLSLLHIQARVTPRSDADIQVISSSKTGDSMVIKGRIEDIFLRTAIIIQPAIIESIN